MYAKPVAIEQVLQSGGSYDILIDDSYFLYIYVGSINVSKAKIRGIASNYISSLLPQGLFAGFGIFFDKGKCIALIYKDNFDYILKNHEALFRRANSVSTCFCELMGRHSEFVFSDGANCYQRTEDGVEILADEPEDVLKANEMWDDLIPLRNRVDMGIKKEVKGVAAYRTPLIFLAASYLLFVLANVLGVMQDSRQLKLYESQLTGYYESAGVAETADPYGMLLSKASGKGIASYRLMSVLSVFGDALPAGVKIDSLNATDRSVKIEGRADTFEEIDGFKEMLIKQSGKTVVVENSAQEGAIVKFVMRYEP